MASDGDPRVRIQQEFCRIKNKRNRIAREVRHLLDPKNQISLREIDSRVTQLAQDRHRLDIEEADLLNRFRIYYGHPSSPASSSPETGVEEHASEVCYSDLGCISRNLAQFWVRRMNDGTSDALQSADSRVEEHVVEVSNTELGGTCTNLSEFIEAPMLNDDTPYTHESADKVEEHAGEVSNTELRGTSLDMTKFWALMMKDGTSYTLESVLGRVEKHTSDVSNTEVGRTSMDLSELLNDDTSHTPESANRVVMHVDTIDSGMPDSTIAEPSPVEKKKPSDIPRKYWPPRFLGTVLFAEIEAEREFAERQAKSLQAQGQCTYASKEDIARNAKEWMIEEALIAFRRYIESEDDLKDIKYEFEELLHQCFNVEHYFKIFHHFNFTVKIKKCGSDWTLMTYFAEVLSILQKKHYFCYPLDPDENGQCYACQNQGMHKLRHPSAEIFECGTEATTCPYFCEDSDSDGSPPSLGGSESDCDMS